MFLWGVPVFDLFVVDLFLLEVVFEGLVDFLGEGGVCFDDGGGFLAGEGGEFWVFKSFHHEVGDAGLADAGELAAAAGVHVFFGEFEAVVYAFKCFEAVSGLFVFAVGDGVAVGLVVAADDATAELVELG